MVVHGLVFFVHCGVDGVVGDWWEVGEDVLFFSADVAEGLEFVSEFGGVGGSVGLPVSPVVFVCAAVSFVEVPAASEFVDVAEDFELWGVFGWHVGDWCAGEEEDVAGGGDGFCDLFGGFGALCVGVFAVVGFV